MRVVRIVSLVVVFASCAAEPQKKDDAPAKDRAVPALVEPHHAEGNGDVVELPLPGSVPVSFRVSFYTGSVDDPAGKEGLTALTARLMAEGGTKKSTYPELLRVLYPMSTEIGVSVSKEQTVFGGDVHSDHVERYVSLLAEVIKEPRLSDADFARIRDDMVNDIEKRLRAIDDENLGKEMLELMLYPKEHPYGHFVGGTIEGLRSITLEDVRQHCAKVFGRKRLVLGVGGNVNPKVTELLKAVLVELADGAPRIAAIAPVSKPTRNEVLIAEKAGKAVAISIGYSHDAFRGHPDFSKLALVQSYLGEHRQFHGLLMSEMREKRGLNYGDYVYVEEFQQEGGSRNMLTNIARRRQHFEIWIRPVDPKDALFALRLAMFLLNQTMTEGIPESSVGEIKEFLLGYTRLWEITPSRRLGFAIDDHFYGTQKYLDQYRADLEKMTASEVNRAMKQHLSAGPVKIAIVAPDAAAMKALLISGERSEKTYDANVDPSVLEMDKKVATFPLGIEADNVHTIKVDELFVR